MPRGKCPLCPKGEIIYNIGQGMNQGKCNECGNPIAYTWMVENFHGQRFNPALIPDFRHIKPRRT